MPDRAPLTRRRFLVATAATGGALGAAWFGRFGLGGTFEDHVARTLGLERPALDGLLATMRDELGPDYDARAAAFVGATAAPGRFLAPERVRREAIESFLGPLFGNEFVAPQVYTGLRAPGPFAGCTTLKRS